MALTLSLLRGGTIISLQDGAAGLQLAEGWQPNVQVPLVGGPPLPVTEALPLLATGLSHDHLALVLQGLHQMQVWAAQYLGERLEQTPVWLYCALAGETNVRRALVYGIDVSYASGWYEAESASYMQNVMATLTRGPWEAEQWWEDMGVLAEQSGVCLTLDYSATDEVYGDLPARINLLRLATAAAQDAIDQYDRFWIGLRSADRHESLSEFVPIWECETTGGVLGTTAELIQDDTASPGGLGDTLVRITATDGLWALALTLDLATITGAYVANYGRFLALLRAKVSSGTYEVLMRWAYGNGALAAEGLLTEIAGTDWDIYGVGQHSLPQRDLHAFPVDVIAPEADEHYQAQFWVRRTSGSGTLDLDCLINLPIDEAYAVVSGADMDYSVGAPTSAYLYIGCAPEDTCQAIVLVPDTPSIHVVPQLSLSNFYLPPGLGNLYIVFAGPWASDIADALAAQIGWTPRWLSLRGAE